MDRPDPPALSPEAALNRIAHILERRSEPTYRVRAFRMAAARVRELGVAEVARHIAAG
jgi:putative hydrolase